MEHGGNAIKELISMCMFDPEPSQEAAASALAVLCYHEEARARIIEEDGIRAIIALITGAAKEADTKREACFAISNMCSTDPEIRKKVAAGGAVHPLIELVRSGGTELCRQHACGALTQLGADDDVRAKLWEAGALDPIIDLHMDVMVGTKARNWADVALAMMCTKKVPRVAPGAPPVRGAPPARAEALCRWTRGARFFIPASRTRRSARRLNP